MLNRGNILGLAAYLMWGGVVPIYFKAVGKVSTSLIIAHRVMWSGLLCVLLLAVWKHRGWWQQLHNRPQLILILCGTGLMTAGNWFLYVWAVNHGRMLEASLGYYINPLVNVLLGMVFLRERLRPLQWVSVALAAIGVLQQILLLGVFPWISMALALIFGFYGLIRKQLPVNALPGLAVETWALTPLVVAWLFIDHPSGQQAMPLSGWLLLSISGPVTLIPLLCYNMAARVLPYSTLGLMQYVAPTMLLLLAVFAYGEPLPHSKLVAFISIWLGLAVFTFDTILAIRQRKRDRLAAEAAD